MLLWYCFTARVELSYYYTWRLKESLAKLNLTKHQNISILKILIFRTLKENRIIPQFFMRMSEWGIPNDTSQNNQNFIYIWICIFIFFLYCHCTFTSLITFMLNEMVSVVYPLKWQMTVRGRLKWSDWHIEPVGFTFNWKENHILLELEGPLGIT